MPRSRKEGEESLAAFLNGPAGGPMADDIFPFGAVLSDTYEIGAQLGQGAMGQVYEATVNGVRREAQALAAIRHPNVVTVHAVREGYLLDIYALGVIAFEMVTGDLPFVAESVPDTLRLQRSAPVPEVTPLHGQVPASLARLIGEMLAKKPAERPQSAEAVIWRLRSIAAAAGKA